MNAIKAVVIGLGVLILAGFAVVAVTLVVRMQGIGEPKGPFSVSATLPKGAQIVETRTGDGRIVLRLTAADASMWLLVLDADTGLERGRIKLLPEGE